MSTLPTRFDLSSATETHAERMTRLRLTTPLLLRSGPIVGGLVGDLEEDEGPMITVSNAMALMVDGLEVADG